MSRPEIFAAFCISRIVDVPRHGLGTDRLEWARDRAGRAGLALDVATTPDLDDLPRLSGEWAGLPAQVRVIDDEEFRALVLVLGESDFVRRAHREDGDFEAAVAEQFRDACDGIEPHYAFVDTVPVDNIAERLRDVAAQLYGLNVRELAGFGFPLWYVSASLADDLDESGPARPAPELPSGRGVVMVAGGSTTGWW